MKARRGRRKIATGRAPGETDKERDFRPEIDESSLIHEIMTDPYWSWRFMNQNGVSRLGG